MLWFPDVHETSYLPLPLPWLASQCPSLGRSPPYAKISIAGVTHSPSLPVRNAHCPRLEIRRYLQLHRQRECAILKTVQTNEKEMCPAKQAACSCRPNSSERARNLCRRLGALWVAVSSRRLVLIVHVQTAELVREESERVRGCLIAVESVLRRCILTLVVGTGKCGLSRWVAER
jgi:hypothetical protein